MKKEQIIQLLFEYHRDFAQTMLGLSQGEFSRVPGSKWSSAQQLDHVLKSIASIVKVFHTPPEVLESKFGLANSEGRDYDSLVTSYLEVLKKLKDFVLPERFVPVKISFEDRQKKVKELLETVRILKNGVEQFEESTLDSHLVRHPAMGNLTLREMLYFAIYHVQHHDRQILENLKNYPE
nr:DinB family protein [Allomuricauda sp.]